jgi:hypothetical protein
VSDSDLRTCHSQFDSWANVIDDEVALLIPKKIEEECIPSWNTCWATLPVPVCASPACVPSLSLAPFQLLLSPHLYDLTEPLPEIGMGRGLMTLHPQFLA